MEQTFLRVDVDDGESFATLADKVRRELFASLRHARHSVSDRGLSYVTLNLLRLPAPDFGELNARVELTPLACSPRVQGAGRGDLRDTFGVHVIGFDERAPLTIGFDFHRETFDAALQERAKRHFLALCDALLTDLERGLDGVELCDETERAQVLALGRGPEPASRAPDALEQIEAAARHRPGHPALRSLGKTLGYSELLGAAGRLAARLAQEGVGRGQRVAFCTPRGLDEPLSMLAAWIVGAAYVPLDPSHPRERTRLILEDAQPRLVITHSTLADRLPTGHSLLLLDCERAAIDALAPLPFAPPADPEDIAYVLFTSGSTGRPKGVEIPRRAIANFLRAMAQRPGLGPADRMLAITTTTFDISALELLLPLCVGALVQIADRETVLDPYLLRETLERDGITVLQATPTTFRLLLEAGFGRRGSKLKLLCGGEAISRGLADKLLATGAELWNMYGPTETTIWSTHARLRAGAGPISIGSPIDATQVYVLSAGGALAPFGVSGELCIGGAGLARGYLGRPDLSAERFIKNPQDPGGGLVYRTGDLARLLPNGDLECLGRLDHQVKVRGFRIELGEIEACLRQQPELREVIVHALARGDEPHLVAYYVAGRDLEDVLREAAQQKLPSYMQPAAYVRLSALPLNTNGKVDRAALPVPKSDRREPDRAQRFASAAEQRMAELFQEVLAAGAVPLERDFFALGGDSVRAMQLRRRIHETFHVELPLSVLFDAPSVRSLVAALRQSDMRPSPLFLQLRPGLRDAAPLICVMGIALYRDLALALETERAVYGVHVPLGLRSGISAPSVEEIARRYTELILERVPRGPYNLAGLCFGGLVAFEVAHQLLRQGHEVRTLAVFDGLLPRGVRYQPLSHARALLEQPEHILQRLRERGERLLRRLRGTEDVADELDLNLQGSQAARLAGRYDARARQLPIPFLLFRASEREEAPWYRVDARLGWGELGAPVTMHSVPGSHLSILRAGNVRAVAEILSQQLADEPARVSRPPLL
jgi:amino acid adenylation domain-containing protein